MKNKLLYTLTIPAIIIFLTGFYGNRSFLLSEKYISFTPGELWKDNNQVHINAHGGGIFCFDDVYYWFGEHKIEGRQGNKAMVGVHCYSSTDLYNWKDCGIALEVSQDPNSEITQGCIIERPKVVYNKKTNTFVMWFHLELKGQGYNAAKTGLAISKKAEGPYQFVRSFRPNAGIWPMNISDTVLNYANKNNLEMWTTQWREEVENGLYVKRDFKSGQMSRDMTVFIDDDGTAYHIHSSEENLTLHISELTPDYQDFTGKWTRIFPGGHNEAPAIFKRNGNYYLITSGCTGWDPNAARSAVAKSIWGPWHELGNPCVGADSTLTFHSQSTYILPIKGMDDAYIFMADRWNPGNPIDGRYIWLPIQFEDNKPVLEFNEKWDLRIFERK